MKRNACIIWATICYTCISTAVAQTSSNAAGGNGSGSGGNIGFSVGQIDFINITNTTNAGVQQTYDSSAPLPVSLLFFQAVRSKQEVDVKWETATEINASHFVVQRSVNGVTFTDIGTINSAGNSNSPRNMLSQTRGLLLAQITIGLNRWTRMVNSCISVALLPI